MGYIVFGNDNRMNEVRKLLVSKTTDDIVCVFPPNMLLILDDIKKIPYGARVYARGVEDENLIKSKNIKFFRYDENDEFLLTNSRLTAEATITILLGKCDTLLSHKKVLLIGFGHSGREIAKYLYALKANFVIMTSKRERAEMYAEIADYGDDISEFDIIINTAPSRVIGDNMLCQFKRDGIIIDIASSPYGLNHDKAKELGIDSDVYPALPSKYKTKASAEAIVKLVTGGEL